MSDFGESRSEHSASNEPSSAEVADVPVEEECHQDNSDADASFSRNSNLLENQGHFYLAELKKQRAFIDPANDILVRLLDQEIERVSKDESDGHQSGSTASKPFIDISSNKPIKLVEKIRIPAEDYPKINFMGRLLGPQGRTLKAIQGEIGCRMAILGKGSVRDKIKEQELLDSGDPKYAHLKEEMHISVSFLSPPLEAYRRLYRVMEAIAPFLRPDFDEKIESHNTAVPAPYQTSSFGGYQSPVTLVNPTLPAQASYSAQRGSRNGLGTSPISSGRGIPRGRGSRTPISDFNSRGRGSSRGGSYSAGSSFYRFRPY